MSHTWDPDLYLRHADDRARPFLDLLARVGAEAPAEVVDLGCGPGNESGLAGGEERAEPKEVAPIECSRCNLSPT